VISEQKAKGRFTGIVALRFCRLPAKLERKENAFGKRIQKDLIRIERTQSERIRTGRAVNSISVINSPIQIGLFDPAMPDPLRFVPRRLKPDLQKRLGHVVFGKQNERNFTRCLGVKGKIISLFFRDIRCSERYR
jgi:hypothetical protein